MLLVVLQKLTMYNVGHRRRLGRSSQKGTGVDAKLCLARSLFKYENTLRIEVPNSNKRQTS